MKKAVWSGVLLMTVLGFAGEAAAQQPPRRAQKRFQAQFKKLDADRDGGISRQEWKRRPKAFDRLDTDHDGILSTQELQGGIRKARKR